MRPFKPCIFTYTNLFSIASKSTPEIKPLILSVSLSLNAVGLPQEAHILSLAMRPLFWLYIEPAAAGSD